MIQMKNRFINSRFRIKKEGGEVGRKNLIHPSVCLLSVGSVSINSCMHQLSIIKGTSIIYIERNVQRESFWAGILKYI